MTDLPKGWSTERLGDIAEVTMGQSPAGSTYNKTGNGVPFFQGKAEFGPKHPTVRQWTTAGKKYAKAGDVLMSVRAPVGPTNVADTDCAIGRGLAAIRAGEKIDQNYLIWYLKSVEASIQARGKGTTFDAISGNDLRDTLVNLPPIEEQKRIIETLDLYIQNLDTTTSELLSDIQRLENLERSARFSEFERANSIDSSNMVQIKDVTEKARSIDPKTLGVDTFKYVDISSISTDLESPQILEETETSKAPSRARQQIMEGDTVFSTVRPYQKKIALIKEELSGQIASTGFCVLRPLSDLVDARYLYHYLKSDMLLDQVLPLQRGASYPAVGDADVKQSTMPLPDLATQQIIARNLDEVVGTVKALKNQLERTIERAQVLRRALLHKAFSGQLIKGN